MLKTEVETVLRGEGAVWSILPRLMLFGQLNCFDFVDNVLRRLQMFSVRGPEYREVGVQEFVRVKVIEKIGESFADFSYDGVFNDH